MKINLYDKNLNRIAYIGDKYKSLLWSEGFNTMGSFTIELSENDDIKKKVKTDYYVGRSDRKTLMVIKSVQASNGLIIATGKPATRVLDDVAFVGTISEGEQIDTVISNVYNSSAKFPNVVFLPTNIPKKYQHQISHKSFLELCETMCQYADMGFKAVKDGKTIGIEFYDPAENPNLVFSRKFGNLSLDAVVTSTEPYKNYAIVLGSGEGNARVRVDVDKTNGEQRRELIVDASGIQPEDGETTEQYRSRLAAEGSTQLLEMQDIFECSISTDPSDFGIKYDLGDIITVYLTDYGMKMKARLAKFTQTVQNNETKTTLEIGKIVYVKKR